MNSMFEYGYEVIKPTTLKNILDSCAYDAFIIAIIDCCGEDNKGCATWGVEFVGNLSDIRYEFVGNCGNIESCIASIQQLDDNLYKDYLKRCNQAGGMFFISPKDFGRYVLEIHLDMWDGYYDRKSTERMKEYREKLKNFTIEDC